MEVDIINAFVQLGFPAGVAIYLLTIQSRQMEKFTQAQNETKIGLYLILARLDLVEDYEKAVKEARMEKKES